MSLFFFILSSFSNSIVYLLPSIILLIVFLKGEFMLGAELSILISFFIFLKDFFSQNIRNIFISKNTKFFLDLILAYRFFLIIILNIISFLLFYLLNNLIISYFIFLILNLWVLEVIFIKDENNYYLNRYIFFLISILIFFIFLFFYYKNIFSLDQIIIFQTFFLLIFIFTGIKINKLLIKKKDILKVFKINFSSSSFYSSFFLNITNFFWRFFIIIFSGKEFSGILLMIFLIASLPGSILKYVIGPTIIKERKIFLNISIIGLFVYLVLGNALIYFLISKKIMFDVYDINYILCLNLSFIGTIFTFLAMIKRQELIHNKPNFNSKVFKNQDIIISIFQFAIIPILYYAGGIQMLIFSYFVISLINYFVYFRINR